MKPTPALLIATCALALAQTAAHLPKPAAAEPPPNLDSIMRQSLQREISNARVLDNYVYEAKESTVTYDAAGHPEKTESKVTEYLWVDGSRYKRVIEENGKPVTGASATREQRKMDAEMAKRRQESPAERQKRLADDARRRDESRRSRDEVARAFTFRLLGEESVSGQKCWKVAAEPKPGFVGQTRIGKVMPKMRGTIWVHQQGYEWLRVEAETLDAITFGGFLAKLDKGSTFKMEQIRVNDELWAVRQINTRVTARALLLHFNQGQQIEFRNYRRFSAESHLVDGGAGAH